MKKDSILCLLCLLYSLFGNDQASFAFTSKQHTLTFIAFSDDDKRDTLVLVRKQWVDASKSMVILCEPANDNRSRLFSVSKHHAMPYHSILRGLSYARINRR
jgi:hypothetical protein